MTALEVVTQALEVVVHSLVGVVVAMQTPVGDDVQTGLLLVACNRTDRIVQGFLPHGVRRLLVAREVASVLGIPPTRVRIVAHHAGGNHDVFVTNLHVLSPVYCMRQRGISPFRRVSYLSMN